MSKQPSIETGKIANMAADTAAIAANAILTGAERSGITTKDLEDAKKAAHQEGLEAGRQEALKLGAEQERARIQGIEAQAKGFPGHDELIRTMKFDGETTAEQAAMKILEAERSLKAKAAKDLHKDAPAPVPQAFEAEVFEESPTQSRDRAIDDYMQSKGASYKEALIAIKSTTPGIVQTNGKLIRKGTRYGCRKNHRRY